MIPLGIFILYFIFTTEDCVIKIFKKQVGVAPKEYLLSKKMEHAAKLLTAGKSVGQVAEVLGYSNPYNFSRAFKKQYGVAPREWG